MKMRILLNLTLCVAVCAISFRANDALAADLGIGSEAPALDVEHWVQDGNGFFKPVTTFDAGKVYVVEFWATWCGPCIASMPHLAELQNKYRGRGVQIVSISDESLDEVKVLLARENSDVGKTFEEITAAYSLTTDPDRSSHIAYMEAANQSGIPTSFLVGKTGLVEWIGHPMELDGPLEAVVTDSWDREAFKAEMKAKEALDKSMQQIAMLAGAGKFDEALKLIDEQATATESEQIKTQLTAVKNSLKLSAGKLDDEVLAFYRGQMQEMKGDAYSMGRFGFSLYGQMQRGAEVGPLAKEAAAAIAAEVDGADDEIKPLMYNTVSLLQDALGNVDAAIEAQQAAIAASEDPRQKERLQPFLDQLMEKKQGK